MTLDFISIRDAFVRANSRARSARAARSVRTPSSVLAIVIILIVTTILTTGAAAAAETWADRLGYPPGSRVVILGANDAGALYEINRPVQELLAQDVLGSASVMVPGPWFHEFVEWHKAHPGHDVGLALTLTCPSPLLRWRSIGARGRLRTLLDVDGYFPREVEHVATRADAAEVEREIRAQIELARASGLQPTHLMTHRGSLLTRPDLLRVYLDTAHHYRIPAVIVEMSPENVERFRERGLAVTDEAVELIRRYRMPKADWAVTVPDQESLESTREELGRLIRELRPGITQILVSPADPSDGLRRVSPRWRNRAWEAQLLNEPRFLKSLEDEGIVLTDWREIMERFENGPDR